MIPTLKLIFISTSVLSAAVALKLSVPAIAEFAASEVPSIYNGVVSWLRPPYLYLLINCIIITILASSKLQSNSNNDHHQLDPLHPHPQPPPPPVSAVVLPHLEPAKPPHSLDLDVASRNEDAPEEAVENKSGGNDFTDLNHSEEKSLVGIGEEVIGVNIDDAAVAADDASMLPEVEINGGYKDEFAIPKSSSSSPPLAKEKKKAVKGQNIR